MREEIIQIIGHGMEPERAECKADEILDLFIKYFAEIVKNNGLCSPFCDGFKRSDEKLEELELLKRHDDGLTFYCYQCHALFREECCCEENADNEYPEELWDIMY